MKQFVISYIAGDQPASPEAGQQHFARYQQWLADLGDAVVKGMVPFKDSHTIGPDGNVTQGSASAMSGHTLIQVESIDAAIAIAKACPFLEINGTLEVAEIVEM